MLKQAERNLLNLLLFLFQPKEWLTPENKPPFRSDGKSPKQALFSNVNTFLRKFEDEDGDPALVLSPFSFDPAILTIFEGVFNCGDLILISRRAILASQSQVESALRENAIKRVFITPSLALRLGKINSPYLKDVLLGGEEFPALKLLRCIFGGSGVNFWNIYGVTEASIWTSIVKITVEDYYPIIDGSAACLVDGISKCSVGTSDNCLQIYVDESRTCLVDSLPMDVVKTNDLVRIEKTQEKEVVFFDRRKGPIVKRNGKKISLMKMKSDLERAIEGMRVLHLFVNQENEILAVVDGTNKSGYEIQAAARSENVPDRIFNYSEQDIPLSK